MRGPSCFGGLPALDQISGKTWLFLALSGLATGASWLCYFRALKLGEASRVAPIDKLSVVVAMALAVIFLGDASPGSSGLRAC